MVFTTNAMAELRIPQMEPLRIESYGRFLDLQNRRDMIYTDIKKKGNLF